MVDGGQLVQALRKELRAIEADLHRREGTHDVLPQVKPALEVELAALAWLSATVFVRFCEDNQLIDAPFLASPGGRLDLTRDRQQAYFRRHPERTDRDWITEALDSLGTSSATLRMFEPLHALMSRHPISHDAACQLVSFWRRTGQQGRLVFDFTDADLDTGFLADLYADISEAARKEFALVQTPPFVAELMMDMTLGSALAERGAAGLRAIDVACAPGTFMLLMLERLIAAWKSIAPAAPPWTWVRNALASVHGVDKNPVAAVITRVRLLVAAMRAAGAQRISEVPDLPIVVAVGDSLLPPGIAAEDGMAGAGWGINELAASDAGLLDGDSYDVVVANPPYLTVRDPSEQALYRELYPASRGRFSLPVPFTQLAFRLARSGPEHAGHVGLLLSNSFAKREFGRALVEDFLPTVDLTHVLDTSGAYIPGHGTPTVILLGRGRTPRDPVVRMAVGIRGEPSPPADGSDGHVWRALVEQVDQPGSTSEWMQVEDVSRQELSRHPWRMSVSDAGGVLARIEGGRRLGTLAARIGYGAVTGADDAFLAPRAVFERCRAEPEATVTVVRGSEIRDWESLPGESGFRPDAVTGCRFPRHLRRLWSQRTTLRSRRVFGDQTFTDAGHLWYAWHQFADTSGTHPWAIAFPSVATTPHFAMLREGITGLQSAPVVRLPQPAPESDYYGLLGVLNSSVAAFWLKQFSQAKGAPSASQIRADEPWEHIYMYTGSRLTDFPLPGRLPVARGQELDMLALELGHLRPTAQSLPDVPTAACLTEMRAAYEEVRRRMIALQEELDWDVYRAYWLLSDDEAVELVAVPEVVPELHLGERAFEIVMARRMSAGELETRWFERHGSTPITQIPAHWPDEYKAVVARRIKFIEENPRIGLLERPEHKRRWMAESWDQLLHAALRDRLLDRCEVRDLWFGSDGTPQPMTVNRLADLLRGDPGVSAVYRLSAKDGGDLGDVLADVLADEHVPYLAQFRYKAEGIVKRAAWERTWDLQRQEDASGRFLDIPVPPAYKNTDFVRPSYWRHRGKLDMPKERFISYPGASPDSDGSLLLGWAGWDHREQAVALVGLIEERGATDGWGADRLTPLLAGLSEGMPWVRQWHSQVDPAFGVSLADTLDAYLTGQLKPRGLSPADFFGSYLDTRLEALGLTDAALRSWTAPPVRRGRPPKTSARRSETRRMDPENG